MQLVPIVPPDRGNILDFPLQHARAETTWSLCAICRMLGQDRRSLKWKRAYLAGLIENAGFPRPLPVMVAGEISSDIHPARSRWLPAAVRAWLDGQLPPEALAARDTAEAAAAADRLDDAADNLFAGGRA